MHNIWTFMFLWREEKRERERERELSPLALDNCSLVHWSRTPLEDKIKYEKM